MASLEGCIRPTGTVTVTLNAEAAFDLAAMTSAIMVAAGDSVSPSVALAAIQFVAGVHDQTCVDADCPVRGRTAEIIRLAVLGAAPLTTEN